MTIRAITFSTPMVQALIEGRKTQTRRTLLPDKKRLLDRSCGCTEKEFKQGLCETSDQLEWTPCKAPSFRVGDILWVREAWQVWADHDDLKPSKIKPTKDILYIADRPDDRWDSKYRHARFMVRWASRLTLSVTSVRVQRLQAITNSDCLAEGICADEVSERGMSEARLLFRELWDSLNDNRGSGWDANPWVVAVGFEVHHVNVDDYLREVAA